MKYFGSLNTEGENSPDNNYKKDFNYKMQSQTVLFEFVKQTKFTQDKDGLMAWILENRSKISEVAKENPGLESAALAEKMLSVVNLSEEERALFDFNKWQAILQNSGHIKKI